MRRLAVLTLAILALTATSSGTASAAGNALTCGDQTYEQPFMRFLDPLFYVRAPGGDFETGAAGWQLSGGARVTPGNEPFFISGGGSNSLYLPAGSSATSPEMCVGVLHPTLRFVAQSQLLATLKVEILFTGLLGQPLALEVLPGVVGTGGWAPSLPLVYLGSVLPATSLGGLTADVRFRFTPRRLLFSAPAWRIDDVYVDPFKLF